MCLMLTKFWFQTVLFVGCGSGKSFLIELIVATTALKVEKEAIVVSIFIVYKSF